MATQVLRACEAYMLRTYCVNQSVLDHSIMSPACETYEGCKVSVAVSHVSKCVCRCGAILCDSLLWQAPCSPALGQEANAMEMEGAAASGNSKPLLRSHVGDYCNVIVEGMKVGLACCLACLHEPSSWPYQAPQLALHGCRRPGAGFACMQTWLHQP